MRSACRGIWLVTGLACMHVAASFAQAAKPKTVQQPKSLFKQFLWWEEEWKKDNKPFHDIRLNLDKQIDTDKNPDTLVSQYRAQLLKNKFDAKAMFRWAYAARRAALVTKPWDINRLVESHNELVTFHRTQRPQVYDFTRLRFLTTVDLGYHTERQQLIQLGERLLEHTPKDAAVKYQLIRILTGSNDISNVRKAIRYAKDLVATNPKDLRYQSMVGDGYDAVWFLTRRRADANIAISMHKKLIELAPAQHPSREAAEFRIKRIQTRQAQWEKQGKAGK